MSRKTIIDELELLGYTDLTGEESLEELLAIYDDYL